MSVFRNALIICGSAWLSHFVVSSLQSIVLVGIYGANPPVAWSPAAGYTWASATVIIFGVLYGGVAGLSISVDRLAWWPLCLAAVAWLGAPASFGRHSFPTAFEVGMAENMAMGAAAVIALVTFSVVRSRARKHVAVASAR